MSKQIILIGRQELQIAKLEGQLREATARIDSLERLYDRAMEMLAKRQIEVQEAGRRIAALEEESRRDQERRQRLIDGGNTMRAQIAEARGLFNRVLRNEDIMDELPDDMVGEIMAWLEATR